MEKKGKQDYLDRWGGTPQSKSVAHSFCSSRTTFGNIIKQVVGCTTSLSDVTLVWPLPEAKASPLTNTVRQRE